MNQALIFLLETFLGLFHLGTAAAVLPAGGARTGPQSAFVLPRRHSRISSCDPTRRVIPGLWGYDLSTLLLAWITSATGTWCSLLSGISSGRVSGSAQWPI